METHDEHTYSRRENRYRPISEVVRGVLFILFGLYALFAEKLGLGQFRISHTAMLIVGVVLLIYGLFRVVNGVRKIFFHRN
ncbi:hypothetical protein SAMN05660909_03230 [Chitinophaga terrae (ex Kim and Jung 2007)]|jgi:uncharacterized membrane protein HdeD (DUF308 family)|uniref:Uncharacterized protein n=1 Tax=Chitinophaga terrae (ex Kim and Jung 2007) TaxID=408074 RepID=A0A1H4DNV9_9BACT|nr:uncharacterized membrane protein HdeD (DUF308 family) [Chitinophaga terrae (ex Kim and Jung 2007)]GEP91029.1 hypothetical protein CTE07_26740 [Chitinophaga terrae (ex Kim and Jung 2007)]SEA74287.1 hypothetical protein SAMN05660909_03230 [Chitinophaga terrae (ex Kim and Jung 2007)]